MKASEMTNEELAKVAQESADFYDRVGYIDCERDSELEAIVEIFREAAARLRNVTVRSDNSAVIAELERRLRVAENALVACRDGMCGERHRQHPGEACVCPNGCYEMSMAKNALAAIRGERDNNDNENK